MGEVNLIEVDEHTYIRTDGVFSILQADFDRFVTEDHRLATYIEDLAARLRSAIIRRKEDA